MTVIDLEATHTILPFIIIPRCLKGIFAGDVHYEHSLSHERLLSSYKHQALACTSMYKPMIYILSFVTSCHGLGFVEWSLGFFLFFVLRHPNVS